MVCGQVGRAQGETLMPSPLILIIAGIVFLAALTGAYLKVHGDGVKQGVAETTAKWDAANRKAEAEEAARLAAADLTAKTSAAELAAMQQKADTYEAKWNLERKRHANSTLAGCVTAPQSIAGSPPAAPTVHFSAGFLHLYDAAWTGDTGQPVFGDSPPAAGQPADTPDTLTAIGPGEVLDNHAANAHLCSADRRKLDSLIDQIERLKAVWH